MNQRNAATTGQVNPTAAETYEAFFVPALFQQWCRPMISTACVTAGNDVLDVGCGTGVLARAAAQELDGSGSVTAVDINDGMLAVARRSSAPVNWQHAPAEQLPFADGSFDRVLSQFALMFFNDRSAALSEMARVTRPGGSVTVATWSDVDRSPGYAAMIDLLDRLFGNDAAAALRAPFTLGLRQDLTAVMHQVLPRAVVADHHGQVRFESLESWVHTDVRGWTLADMIDDAQYAELLAAARVDLAEFVEPDGQVRFPAEALIATASV